MPDPIRPRIIAMGLLGAAVGGYVGYLAFFWIVRQGFYALIVPPALLGFVAGQFARERSTPLAVICGIAGFLLALFTEWQFRPFVDDEGFPYFITHVHQLNPVTLLMVALGTFASYRLALGHDSRTKTA